MIVILSEAKNLLISRGVIPWPGRHHAEVSSPLVGEG
jgi:hypothetical protein